MRSIRHVALRSVLLAAAVLGPACASTTEGFSEATSTASDAGTPDAVASRGDACSVGNDSQVSLYERCAGHNDASRGTCSAGEICGSMPDVGYDYCMLGVMPGVPCPTGMVSVINLACAYPCDDASACTEHGLVRCAENSLAELTGGPFGWCTP